MRLSELQDKFHRRMLECRAIDSFIYTERFEAAWDSATFEQRDKLVLILKSGQLAPVKAWAKDRLAGPLRFQSYRQLRDLGKRENISRWSRLTRDELIEILEKKSGG